MKKSFIAFLSVIMAAATIGMASAKTTATSPATAAAIRYYKAGNYIQSYLNLKEIVKRDPSNGLAYYYLGMSSTQLGKRGEALENYDRAIALSPNGVLGKYAKWGKRCIEMPDKCHVQEYDSEKNTPEDIFIKNKKIFTNEARNADETERIENIKREINRNMNISPQEFKEYKDFSSEVPTSDEIANALKTLQKAGLSGNADMFALMNSYNHNLNSEYDILNSLLTNTDETVKNLSPQVIKSLLTNQMTSSF